MFEKKVWNDRQSEHPARRRLTPTENDNEYEVSRAEGLVMEEGDAFDATTMNDLENRVAKAFAEYDPAELGAVNVTVQLYTCKKEGKVYQLTGSGAVGRCKIPAAWASGDTWTVNGTTVPAYCGADAVDGDTIVAGRWAIFTFDGQQLNFNGGGGLSSGKLARATAKASQVLDGVPFYAGSKTLQKGTMRNNGSWPDADKLTLETESFICIKQTAIRRAVWKRLHRCWEMLRLLTLCKELRHHRPKASMWPGVLWTEETGAHKSYLAVKLQFRLGVMRAMAA